jgi:hypothetical protein
MTISYLSALKADEGNGTTKEKSPGWSFFRIDPSAPALLGSTSTSETSHSTIFPFTEVLSRHPSTQNLQYNENFEVLIAFYLFVFKLLFISKA